MQEIHDNLDILQNTVPIVTVSATDIVGAEIDLQGCNALEIVWNVGIATGTLSGSIKTHLLIEVAPDDGTGSAGSFVSIVDAQLLGGDTASSGIVAIVDAAAEDPAIFKFGIAVQDAAFRFVRPTIVVTGDPLAPTSVVAIKGRLESMPQGGIS